MLRFENQYKGSDKEEFIKAVNKYASKLGIDPNWLMSLMMSESGLRPEIDNGKGFVGLIQFGPLTRKQLGVTKEELIKMGGAKQMEYVYKFYLPFAKKGLIKQFTDLYLITFYPNADGVFGGTLTKPDNWKFPKKVTNNNPGIWRNKKINFDGGTDDISIKSFRSWALSKIPKEEQIKDSVLNKSEIISKVNEPTATNPQDERSSNDSGYITYIHNYSDIKSLDELIRYKQWNKPGSSGSPSGNELLNFEDNKTSIRAAYSKKKSKDISDSELKDNVAVGARLKIPISWIQPEFLTFDGSSNVFPNEDIETFISDSMLKATASPEYRTQFLSGAKGGSVTKVVPKVRVWIWCKSLAIKAGEGNIPRYTAEGAIFDLSPFLTSVNISTGGNAGTFNINLPPLICECTETGWKIKTGTLQEFTNKDKSGERNFTSKGFVNYQTENNELRRSKFLFHTLISANDIVWISMDNPLVEPIEGLRGVEGEYNLNNPKIDKAEVPNRFWDMIGLIDTNSQSYQSASAMVGISITGRDCMKLLIEDSSYYLTLPEEQEQAIKAEGLFVNDNPENWGRPARVSSVNMTSKLFSLQISSARSVGEMLSFIMSSMAAIEIAPDKLFSGYQQQEKDGLGFGISRYEFFDYKNKKNQTFKAAGIWQIIKLQIDNYAVNDRTVIENRLAVHSGSLLNAMKLFADGRFIELFGDTYVDQFFIMVRRPPFNKKGVFDYIRKITGASPSGPVFEIDKSVEKKANTPKLLKDSDKHIESQNNHGHVENGQTIQDDIVLSDTFNWYNGDVFCWYRISLPSGNAADRTYASDKFPVIFFREYCEIWGNKSLDVQSNYVPWNKIPMNAKQKEIQTTFETQLYEDLAYLVESNAYLPFTRSGSITIHGDRRIKAKTWIRYIPTGEIFYVDKVSNSYQISEGNVERITTISVSRGMVEYNASGQYILPLYFRIIDGLPNSLKPENDEIKEEVVDDRILNIFFDFDKSTLIQKNRDDLEDVDLINDLQKREELSNQSDKAIEELLSELINRPDVFVKITGHTDENGDANYNKELSLKRAKTVKDELVRRYKIATEKQDIEVISFAKRLEIQGEGESKPLKTNKGTSGDEKRLIDAKNRRIEVKIIRKDKKENKTNPNSSKENDWAKWRVNPNVFNFFKARRQFCERVDDLENITKYIKQVQPTELKIENDNKPDSKIKEGNESSSTINYLHNNDSLIDSVDSKFKNIHYNGQWDDEISDSLFQDGINNLV